jgi:hypothetical protein
MGYSHDTIIQNDLEYVMTENMLRETELLWYVVLFVKYVLKIRNKDIKMYHTTAFIWIWETS